MRTLKVSYLLKSDHKQPVEYIKLVFTAFDKGKIFDNCFYVYPSISDLVRFKIILFIRFLDEMCMCQSPPGVLRCRIK